MIKKLEKPKSIRWVDAISKINELVDVVNTIQKEREAEWFEIQEWIGILGAVRKSVNVHEKQIDELQMKIEPEKCKTPAKNAQDRMIGCTTLDIPESYKTEPKVATMSEKEFPSCAYDVCAEFDCEETMALALIATRNDLERTRNALDVAKDALKRILNHATAIDTARCRAEMALNEITELEKKHRK